MVVVTRVAMVMLKGLLVVGHMRGSGGGDGVGSYCGDKCDSGGSDKGW